MQSYLSTDQAAAYLGIKERKLYELVANGAVPCSKVTGKWLFPRDALDRWVEAGLVRPSGLSRVDAPPIIGGSSDPLLEWAARRSACGLALLSEGSEAGLARLERNDVAMAAIHLHALADTGSANLEAVTAAKGLNDAVVVAFARREQGLVVAPGNPLALHTLEDAITRSSRFGQRQPGAGAQLLLETLLAKRGQTLGDLNAATESFSTGRDLAFAIRAGDVDCGLATRAMANADGLGFVAVVWEDFDIVMRRRTYFEPGPQRLLALMRMAEFHRHGEMLGGFDTSASGMIRLNR